MRSTRNSRVLARLSSGRGGAQQQWSAVKGQKIEKESKCEEQSAEKDWKTKQALARHFGSKRAAANYAKKCDAWGPDWSRYNSMAEVWEYKHVQLKERVGSKRSWELTQQWDEQDRTSKSKLTHTDPRTHTHTTQTKHREGARGS